MFAIHIQSTNKPALAILQGISRNIAHVFFEKQVVYLYFVPVCMDGSYRMFV